MALLYQLTAMASKLLLERLQTLTGSSPRLHNKYCGSYNRCLNLVRHYSDSANSPPAPGFQLKSSLNQDELKKFSAIAETWYIFKILGDFLFLLPVIVEDFLFFILNELKVGFGRAV